MIGYALGITINDVDINYIKLKNRVYYPSQFM